MDGTEFQIVPMLPEMVPRAAEIEAASFSDPWSARSLREELESPFSELWAAVGAGGLLGYAALRVVLDEGQVTNIAVDGAARRRGVGAALLAAIIKRGRARKLQSITLEVRESNAPAIALYARFGFAPVGLRRGYYHNPSENAVLMTVQLDT